jgi:Protein of unknown function (DUF551)
MTVKLKWIDVLKLQPKDKQKILVSNQYGIVDISYYRKLENKLSWFSTIHNNSEIHYVTHWAELPICVQELKTNPKSKATSQSK